MTADRDERPEAVALAERYGLSRTTARPSLPAYLKQLWDRRHFTIAYAEARTTSRYSGSQLGQLWQVLTPLLNAGVYLVLFGILLDTRRGVDNFIAFLVAGVFVFTFTQRSLDNGAKSINGNLSLVRALHFPRAVLPLSFVLVELKQLMISVAFLLAIIPLTGLIPSNDFPDGTGDTIMWSWLLVIPAIVLHMLFNLGISLVMARIGAASRDINQLLPFISRVWFYTSGVFYSIDRFGPKLGPAYPILQLNPGAVFLDLYRSVLIGSHEPLDLPFGLNIWLVAACWSVILLIGGFIFFWAREERYGRG